MVPDTVEELNVAADGKSLDTEFLRFKLSDPDDHALEQALMLKEKHGGKVTVVALDAPEVDDVLFTALAKGADRAVKIPINQAGLGTTASAKVLADFFAAAGALAAGHAAAARLAGDRRPRGRDRAVARRGVEPAVRRRGVRRQAGGRQGHGHEGVRRRPARRVRGDAARRAGHSVRREAAALRARRQGARGDEVRQDRRGGPDAARPADPARHRADVQTGGGRPRARCSKARRRRSRTNSWKCWRKPV